MTGAADSEQVAKEVCEEESSADLLQEEDAEEEILNGTEEVSQEEVPHVSEAEETDIPAEETSPATEEKDLANTEISLEYDSAVYDGEAKTPAVTVSADTAVLTEGTDYSVEYSNNTNAGAAEVSVSGLGSYTGSVSLPFTITKASQNVTVDLSNANAAVGGTAKVSGTGKGDLTYVSSNENVAAVSAEGLITAKKAGRTRIYVKASGDENYNAGKSYEILTVVPASTKITRVYNSANGLKMTWEKSAGASGYYIYRSEDGNSFELVRTLKSGSTLKATDKTAEPGKKYYYRISSYCGNYEGAVSGVKCYYRIEQPVITKTSNPSSGKAAVYWDPAEGADGYRVTCVSGETERSVLIKDGSATSKVFKNLTNGKTYKFYIKAFKDEDGKRYCSSNSLKEKIKVDENILKITGSGSERKLILMNPSPDIKSLKAAVWSDTGLQDDLVWYTFVKTAKGNFTATASASVIRHPGRCVVHCYTTDKQFIRAGFFQLTEEEQANAVNSRIHAYAQDILGKVGSTLRAAYNWAMSITYQSLAVPMTVPTSGAYAGLNRQELYFVYAYETRRGNCFCYAGSFYWMARELGYTARLIEGQCMYSAGTYGPHAWVEMDLNASTYIFDPEINKEKGFDGYMKTYENGPPLMYRKTAAY